MTLDDLERRNSPYFAFFTKLDSFAGQLRHSGRRQSYNVRKILSPRSSLPLWPKLTHPAARSLCDSWDTCQSTLCKVDRVQQDFLSTASTEIQNPVNYMHVLNCNGSAAKLWYIPIDSCRLCCGKVRDNVVVATAAAAGAAEDDDNGVTVLSPSSLAPRPLSVTDPLEPTLPSSPASSSAVAKAAPRAAGHFTHIDMHTLQTRPQICIYLFRGRTSYSRYHIM